MNTLDLCSSDSEACYCKSLWFVRHRRQPCWEGMFFLNVGTWLSNISAMRTGWSVEEAAHCGDKMCFSVLSKMKTTEAGEGIPSGRKWGARIGLQVIFKTYPPSQSVQTSAAFPPVLRKDKCCTAFSSHSATCKLKSRPNIWPWRNKHSLSSWVDEEVPEYFSHNICSSKKDLILGSTTFEKEINNTQN